MEENLKLLIKFSLFVFLASDDEILRRNDMIREIERQRFN